MTDTPSTTPSAKPGTDVVAAVVLAVALVVGGAVALAVAGSDDDAVAAPGAAGPTAGVTEPAPGTSEPAPQPTEQPAQPTAQPPGQPGQPTAGAGACSYPVSQEPAAKDVGLPPATPLPVAGRTAVLDTNAGKITLTLSPSAPCTTSSFAFLAGKGYFDDSPCHRLVTEGIFVLQCGDPTGQGTGGPGYTLPDEALEGATYPAGTVAMGNTGQPGTGGSQFFLVYEDSPLPPQYTPWAKVTGGLDVIKQIAAGGAEPAGDGAPKKAVTIGSVSVR